MNKPTPTPRTDELYRDHMSDPYQDTGDLAAIMHIQCEKLERELTAVTEQRDEARGWAQYYRNIICDSKDNAGDDLLPWEKPDAVKGWSDES